MPTHHESHADEILGIIEQHRVARREGNRDQMDEVALRLTRCQPLTLHGCVALLNYFASNPEGIFPAEADDGVPFAQALARNVALGIEYRRSTLRRG